MNRIIRWENTTNLDDFPDHSDFLNFLKFDQPTFCIYVGHTNFELKESDLGPLDKINGIEAVKITSRYRIMVFIGVCFNDDWPNIMLEIERSLNCTSEIQKEYSSTIKYLIEEKTKELSKQHQFWCIYVFPNSEMITIGGNSKELINKNISLYADMLSLSGGIVVLDKSSMKEFNDFKQKNIRAIQQ